MTGHRGHATGHIDLARIEREDARLQALVAEPDRAGRIARALAAVEPADRRAHWEARFLQAQQRGFVPAGRIASAAGTDLTATLINCFVQPVGDSIASVDDGLLLAAVLAALGFAFYPGMGDRFA